MSDTPRGYGWWLAVDGLYYPPERHPGYVPPTEVSGPVSDDPDMPGKAPDRTDPPTSIPPPGGPGMSSLGSSYIPASTPSAHTRANTASDGPDGAPGTARILSQRPKRSRKMAGLLATVISVGLMAALGIFLFRPSSGSDHTSGSKAGETVVAERDSIAAVASACDLSSNVGDNGASVSIDTEGEDEYSGDSISSAACLLEGLDAPDWVISRIDSTRALDGTLDAEWDDYEAFWNYHPDSGLNLTVHDAE